MRAAVGVVFALLAASRVADARPHYDPAVDVELFQLAIGPRTFFTVADADTADRGQLTADVAFTYATDPFELTAQNREVVREISVAQLAASYGVFDWLQVGAMLPVVIGLDGDALDAKTGEPASGGLEVHGIGDLRLEAEARLWRRHHLRLSVVAGGTIATSDGSQNAQFTGDNSDSARARFALQWDRGRLVLGANAGVIVRTARDVYGVNVGDAATWGVAAAVRVTERFSIVGEGFGELGIASADSDQMPTELVAGVRVLATPTVAISVGGGAGVNHDLGAPAAQVFVAAGYAPDVRDSDGDGIPNSRDKCPLVPEDKDGFQDADGCPDDDNDGDRIPDREDKCPNEPEDHDGFQDEDGCPDPDNDHDGILDADDRCPDDPEDGLPPLPHDGCPATKSDADGDGIVDSKDKCPLEPEDFDGFQDADGCPDPDNDNDGIPDDQDKCPMCPEDKDGFQDADGCPDLDNDDDGIPDSRDKCPNDPETVNGVQDEDGCPDSGGILLVHLDGDNLVVDKAPSLAPKGAALSHEGELIVGEMALVMAAHHEVTQWTVAVAQPNSDAAKQLAAAVAAELARRGVTGVRVLDTVGPSKIAGAITERGNVPPC